MCDLKKKNSKTSDAKKVFGASRTSSTTLFRNVCVRFANKSRNSAKALYRFLFGGAAVKTNIAMPSASHSYFTTSELLSR